MLLLAVSIAALTCLKNWRLGEFVLLFFLAAAVYGFAVWCILKGAVHGASREGATLAVILVVAGLLRAIALFAPQALSTDLFRYVWDGRVQAAGVNPYLYVPADPALSALRDTIIYPNINRADYAHTIYPPTAQIVFWGVTRFSSSVVGMKLGMMIFDCLTIGCLIALLRAQGLSPNRVLLYAWHPLPIWEFAGTGHVDALAVGLTCLAFLAFARRAPVWTGVALAAATLVKYYPVVVAPALYRRWDWRMPAAFAFTIIVLYAPYLGAGRDVLGFLPGYVAEEGLHDGSGIFLWALLRTVAHLPANAIRFYAPIAALALIMLAVGLQFVRQSRRQPLAEASLMAAVFTLLVSPHDPWYFAWIVPFLCFRPSLAHLWLTLACVLMYVLPDPAGVRVQALVYVPFVILLAMQYLIERRFTLPENIDAHRDDHPSRA